MKVSNKTDWVSVGRLEHPDGEHAVEIVRRPDGAFHYVELRWFGPWDDGDGPLDEGYWDASTSGIFASASLAEAEARRVVDWLRSAD